ncbi:hypothetical protein [Nocardiopsis potens]|uniref:hypothetical protein n=1 Tax=Nocardiopsis potens TaxID=1246458 RepID=UPI00034D121C|nr:hypothetical protein [Nocardiopsis potens]
MNHTDRMKTLTAAADALADLATTPDIDSYHRLEELQETLTILTKLTTPLRRVLDNAEGWVVAESAGRLEGPGGSNRGRTIIRAQDALNGAATRAYIMEGLLTEAQEALGGLEHRPRTW